MNYSYKTIRDKMVDKYHDFNNIGYFIRVPNPRYHLFGVTYDESRNMEGITVAEEGDVLLKFWFPRFLFRLYDKSKNEDWELRNLTGDNEYSIYGITNFYQYSKYHKELLRQTFNNTESNVIITNGIKALHERYLKEKLCKVL